MKNTIEKALSKLIEKETIKQGTSWFVIPECGGDYHDVDCKETKCNNEYECRTKANIVSLLNHEV